MLQYGRCSVPPSRSSADICRRDRSSTGRCTTSTTRCFPAARRDAPLARRWIVNGNCSDFVSLRVAARHRNIRVVVVQQVVVVRVALRSIGRATNSGKLRSALRPAARDPSSSCSFRRHKRSPMPRCFRSRRNRPDPPIVRARLRIRIFDLIHRPPAQIVSLCVAHRSPVGVAEPDRVAENSMMLSSPVPPMDGW